MRYRRRRRSRARFLFPLAVIAAAVGALGYVVWRPDLSREAASGETVDPAMIQHGAQLAAIGNCNVCHTAEGGAAYAGGRPIPTPFGVVYSTNITPDPETGIGGWSAPAFSRAMREGVSRDGRHLYPAFPYDHMTRMEPGDIRLVYAFLMTRQPVKASVPPNDLSFPFSQRWLVAFWKLLFLDEGAATADARQSAEWNRGAYLVEGLGHCGACHTPRNLFGAEKRGADAYAGGVTEGWEAPALNASSPAAVPWEAERLYRYLRSGRDELHGLATGPMAPVVRNLATVNDADVQAMSVYVATMAGAPEATRAEAARQAIARASGQMVANPRVASHAEGAALYAGACAQCHGEAGRAPAIPALHLALSSSLRLERPDNALRIVAEGVHRPDGPLPDAHGEPVMPGFAAALDDRQLAVLANYLRAAFTEYAPWSEVDTAVRRVRETQKASLP